MTASVTKGLLLLGIGLEILGIQWAHTSKHRHHGGLALVIHGLQDPPHMFLRYSQAQLLAGLPQGRVHHILVSGVTLAAWETKPRPLVCREASGKSDLSRLSSGGKGEKPWGLDTQILRWPQIAPKAGPGRKPGSPVSCSS